MGTSPPVYAVKESVSDHFRQLVLWVPTVLVATLEESASEMAFMAVLESDLRALSAEARRRYPAVKDGAEHAILKVTPMLYWIDPDALSDTLAFELHHNNCHT